MKMNPYNFLILVFAILSSALPASAEYIYFSANSQTPVAWTHSAPCHRPLEISVRQDGGQPLPILIEVRKPGVALSAPPSFVKEFVETATNRGNATYTFPGNETGCVKPWTIRVKPKASAGTPSFDGRVDSKHTLPNASLLVEDAIFLGKGKSLTKNLGGSGGLSQGWVEVTGKWNHSVFGAPGPLPVKLNFELLKPDGSIAVYDTGYSSHEINPFYSGDKLKIRFLVREHSTGQWKLRIRNDTGDDVMSIDPSATYTPACP